MVIDPVVINTPDIKGQQDPQTNNGQAVSGQANSRTNGGKAVPDDLVTINSTTGRQADKPSSLQAGSTKAASTSVLLGEKGVIALDDDKNVVVRFFDNNGKIVQQYPPDEYLRMMKELNLVTESLFHKKA